MSDLFQQTRALVALGCLLAGLIEVLGEGE